MMQLGLECIGLSNPIGVNVSSWLQADVLTGWRLGPLSARKRSFSARRPNHKSATVAVFGHVGLYMPHNHVLPIEFHSIVDVGRPCSLGRGAPRFRPCPSPSGGEICSELSLDRAFRAPL
jgi:hypothetical protein